MEKNINAIEELEKMDGGDLFAMLIKSAWLARKTAAGKGYGMAQRVKTQEDAQEVAAEAFLTLRNDAERAAAAGEPLTMAAYRAAWKAIKRIDDQERRNAADSIEEAEENAQQSQGAPIIAISTETAPGEELEALDRIKRAAADDLDIIIIDLLAGGATRAEVAAFINVSRQAVEKRLTKIKSKMK